MHLARLLPALLSIAFFGLAGAAHAAEQPVVAVLYVDNHSGDPSQDVLAKGLADMLVTDLLAQGLTVVERARLQALIDEQALQKTAFFDAKTAVRVGKGLGASHVVIGALASVKPEMRLDLRLVDVSTGAIAVTAKAQGDGAKLFELEQTLVARFVEAFERRFAPQSSPQTKVRDAAALLEYSHGLDLADRGELEEAKKRMEQTIRLSPGFVLARRKKDELVKRIEESRERRDAMLLVGRTTLGAKAKAALARPEPSAERVAWRNVEVQLLGGELVEHLSAQPLGVAALGHEKALRAAAVAYAQASMGLTADLDRALAADGTGYLHAALPKEDEKTAREAGLEVSVVTDPSQARVAFARFVMLGELRVPKTQRATMAPPLGLLDAAWMKRAETTLGEAKELALKSGREHQAIAVLDMWAEALYLYGKTDEAVAKWQEALDRFPTSPQFDNIERQVKRVLGMDRDHTTRELDAWANGLTSCVDMSLRVGLDTVVYRRMRILGIAAVSAIVAEAEKACRGKPPAERFWGYLYSHLALVYGKHLYCRDFEAFMARSREYGTPQGDIDGWRQNWTKCPLPATP